MSVTTQRIDLPSWPAILKSLHHFAVLPDWLLAAAQPESVRDVLSRSIPEFASGRLNLQRCKPKHLLLSDDGISWTGIYHLTFDALASGQQQSLALRGRLLVPGQAEPEQASEVAAFGSEEWRTYVPDLRLEFQAQPPDMQLAAMQQLTDPEQARVLLEQTLKTISPTYHELHIDSCEPQILRYHPGSRCTMGYHLTYASELVAQFQWPTFVVVKTYDGDKGQNAYESMKALWNSPLGASAALTIAEPLAYVPELKLLVQGTIQEEQTLQALLQSTLTAQAAAALPALDDYMRKSAIGLAELHNSGVSIGTTYTWADELAEVRASVERLTAAIPELADAATALLACFESLGSASPPDPLVPAHGTFRPAQVLLDHGQVGFIDFDSFCQAEPARDVALFIVSTTDIGMSAFGMAEHPDGEVADDRVCEDHLTRLASITDAFLAQYAAHHSISRYRVAVWAALNTLDLVIRSWNRVKPARLHATIRMLERQLRGQLT